MADPESERSQNSCCGCFILTKLEMINYEIIKKNYEIISNTQKSIENNRFNKLSQFPVFALDL